LFFFISTPFDIISLIAYPYANYNKYHKDQLRQWVVIEVFALIFLFQPKGGKSKATEHRSVSPC